MAESEEQAVKLIEQEYLQYTIASLNLDISGIKEVEENEELPAL